MDLDEVSILLVAWQHASSITEHNIENLTSFTCDEESKAFCGNRCQSLYDCLS